MSSKSELIRKFKEEFTKNVGTTRDWSKLWEYLLTTDFFDAPAAGSYHNNFPGGLAEHILNFNRVLTSLISNYDSDSITTKRSNLPFNPFLVAVGHDFNKINNYKYNTKNVKDKNGKWQEVIYYDYSPARSMPSNVYSLQKMESLIELSESEKDAIFWAEGAWSCYNNQSLDKSWKSAMSKDIRVYLTHVADMLASQYMEPVLGQFEVSDAIKSWSKT